MVLFLKRPDSQSQFSLQLSIQLSDKEPVQDLQLWMQDHLAEDLTVSALAKQVRISPRHFARLFRRTVGLTPARYVEKLRADTARRRLEESVDPLKIVASEAGFGSVETMRRIFGSLKRRRASIANAFIARWHQWERSTRKTE